MFEEEHELPLPSCHLIQDGCDHRVLEEERQIKRVFPLDLLGVSCGRDIDEALGIFPFTRDVSLGLLAVEEEEAGADILGILETVEPAGGGVVHYY